MIKLVKIAQDIWYVGLPNTKNEVFDTIEEAATFLVSKHKISDDTIDDALCHMAAEGHTTAVFSDSGGFVRTEETLK